jgi:hypothetical protein
VNLIAQDWILKGHLHEGEHEREQGEFLLLKARER